MTDKANSYDCIVVGGGPGGCVAAAILAGEGYHVALVEREKSPRYHVGESMIPYNYFPLERAGMIEKMKASDFPKKYSVQFVGRDGKQSQPFYFSQHLDHPCAQTWQVTRDVFDAMLLDHARERGVEVFEQMSARELVEQDERTVGIVCADASGAPHTFHARVTVDASGGKGFAMSRLSWRMLDEKLQKHAVWAYYRGAARDPGLDEGATTITYAGGKNWLWYIPLQYDIVSVGAVGDKDYLFGDTNDLSTVLNREVEGNVWMKNRVAAGVLEGTHHVCVHRSYRSKYCAKDGLVLVGDALTFLDPVFSTGMYLALVSAERAADAVIAGLRAGDVSGRRFVAYGEGICRHIEALRRLVYAFYAKDFSFGHLMKKYPNLKGAVTDCLVGNLDQDFTALHNALSEFLDLPDPVPYGRAKI